MSCFPDCRNDDSYNEDFLDKQDKEFVRGFDYCLEQIKNLFENNLDVYASELSEVWDESLGEQPEDEIFATRSDFGEIIEANRMLISLIVEHWCEMDRDELITSMIDNMDEDVYEAIKHRVLSETSEKIGITKYFDTRKFAYTGKKVFTGNIIPDKKG